MSPVLASTMIKFLALLAVTKVPPVTSRTGPLKCENGGVSDGNRCICPVFTEGDKCQTIINSIEIGKSFDAKMEATLLLNYTGNQIDFEKEYNVTMNLTLHGIGYHKLKSYKFDGDLVTATSDVFVRIGYNNTFEVSEQYEEKYKEVVAAFEKNKCISRALCIKTPTIQAVRPPSKDDRCAEIVSPSYLPFFDPVVSDNGTLSCVSRCVPGSPNTLDCNDGSCQIRGEEGPQCFCPRTDLYLYTYPRCGGAVPIAALYGGVGASIGLLVIAGVVLGVFLYRRKYYY